VPARELDLPAASVDTDTSTDTAAEPIFNAAANTAAHSGTNAAANPAAHPNTNGDAHPHSVAHTFTETDADTLSDPLTLTDTDALTEGIPDPDPVREGIAWIYRPAFEPSTVEVNRPRPFYQSKLSRGLVGVLSHGLTARLAYRGRLASAKRVRLREAAAAREMGDTPPYGPAAARIDRRTEGSAEACPHRSGVGDVLR